MKNAMHATVATAMAVCVLTATSEVAAAQGWRKKCFDAGAVPVIFGANWQLTGAGIDPDVPKSAEQLEVAEFEINGSCGVRVESSKRGVPLAITVRDNQTNATLAATLTQQLIGAGAVALVGGGNSVVGPPAVQPAVQLGVPFGVNQAAADSLSGCTPAELANPAVVKSPTPVYAPGQCWNNHGLVFRTTVSGYTGGVEAGKYARGAYPSLTSVAFLYRNDDFGRPNRDGFRDTFVAGGGAYLAEAGFAVATATVQDFKNLLRAVTVGNPSMIASNPNVSRLKLLIQAYVELRDDPTWTTKPSNFDILRFVWTTTATAGTFTDMSAAALATLVNQSEAVQATWDPNSIGFQPETTLSPNWFALYTEFNPNAQPPTSSFGMLAYDATIVMALAITAAGSTDGAAIAAKLKEVTGPPGKCVYPGEWSKAFKFLAKGKKINYEGALGPVDLDERGNATGIPHGLFRWQPDGTASMVRLLTSTTQSACDPDDDVDDD